MAEELAALREQVYRDPRPPEHFARFHTRTRTRDPDPVYELVRGVTSLYAWTFFRARCIASENVPPAGPVILAPNHFSFMDHFFLGAFIRRKVHFMAKSQLFQPPLQWIYTHGGVFPVRRGHRDEEAFITAEAVLGRGATLAMYCEGGRSRTGQLAERARPGIGRLALGTGAAVVPTAIYGSQRVRNWRKLQFPKVVVQYGEPVVYERRAEATREQHEAVANDIFGRIKQLYAGLERDGERAQRRAARARARAGAGAATA